MKKMKGLEAIDIIIYKPEPGLEVAPYDPTSGAPAIPGDYIPTKEYCIEKTCSGYMGQ